MKGARLAALVAVLGCGNGLGPEAELGSLRLSLEVVPAVVPQGGPFVATSTLANRGRDTVRLASPSQCVQTLQLFRGTTRIDPWWNTGVFCLAATMTVVIPPGEAIQTRIGAVANGPPGSYTIRTDWEPAGLPHLEAALRVR